MDECVGGAKPARLGFGAGHTGLTTARNKITRVDFVKVDIEGGEYNFLKGGGWTIENRIPIMSLEQNDIFLRSSASRDLVLTYLEDLCYNCFRIRDANDALAISVRKMDALK